MYKLNYVKLRVGDSIEVKNIIKSDVIDNELISMMMCKHQTNDQIQILNIPVQTGYNTWEFNSDPEVQSTVESLGYAQSIERNIQTNFVYRTFVDDKDIISMILTPDISGVWLSDNNLPDIVNTDKDISIESTPYNENRLLIITLSDEVITSVSESIHENMRFPHKLSNTILLKSDVNTLRSNYQLTQNLVEPKSGMDLGDGMEDLLEDGESGSSNNIQVTLRYVKDKSSEYLGYCLEVVSRLLFSERTSYIILPHTIYNLLPGELHTDSPVQVNKVISFERYRRGEDEKYPVIIEYNNRYYLRLYRESSMKIHPPRKDWMTLWDTDKPRPFNLKYFKDGYVFGMNQFSIGTEVISGNDLNWIAL